MRNLVLFMILFLTVLVNPVGVAQERQAEVDTLIVKLQQSESEWGKYSDQLIAIGEPAVGPLIGLLEDTSRNEWSRRAAATTLNKIRSPAYLEPALKLLLERGEPVPLRNQVAIGLQQYNLSNASQSLWKLFQEESDANLRLNLAGILRNSDPDMAYQAYQALIRSCEGPCRKLALINLLELAPGESMEAYIFALQTGDWMAADMAMDSLIRSNQFNLARVIRLYRRSDTPETVRWRTIYVLGHRPENDYADILLEALTDPGWLVHNEAALALARMPAEQVLPDLRVMAQQGDSDLISRAEWVIRKLDREPGPRKETERPSASMQPFGGYPLIQDKNRIRELLRTKCVDTITFRKGEVIADIGAGNGYLEAMLSIFHEDLTFYIQDIDSTVCNPEAVRKVVDFYQEVNGRSFTNRFISVNGTDTDTRLPDQVFDKILMLWTYQYLTQPTEFITGLKRKLKKGGLFYVINPDQDYEYGKLLSMEFGWNGSTVEKQIADIIRCGFELVGIARNYDSDEKPYVMVFKKK